MAFDLPFAVAHAPGNFLHRDWCVDILLHDQQGTLHNRIARFKVHRDAGLWFFSLKGIINNHDVQTFIRLRPPDMFIDQICRQMR